ncbi:MAG TPA: carboxypeptidase-like regulatory domain-containing protein [Thermoleophilaceae bacterium]|nr:carboxypeptidase-like regulatory domain-containing protein [Thermoleophilaceae bacterium]
MGSARRILLGTALGAILLVGGAFAADEDSIKDEKSTGGGENSERCDIRSLEVDKTKKSVVVTVGLRGAQKEFINTHLSINTSGNARSNPEFIVDQEGNVRKVVSVENGQPLTGFDVAGQGKATASGKNVIFKFPLRALGAAKKIGAQAQTCGEGAVDIAPGKDYFGDKSYDGSVDFQYLTVDGAERVIEGRVLLNCSGDRSCKEIPVKGAKVTAKGPKKTYRATTAEDGRFGFAVKKGVYKVTATAGFLRIKGNGERVDVKTKKSGKANFDGCGIKQAAARASAVGAGTWEGAGKNGKCDVAAKVSWTPSQNRLLMWWYAVPLCGSFRDHADVTQEALILNRTRLVPSGGGGGGGNRLTVAADAVHFNHQISGSSNTFHGTLKNKTGTVSASLDNGQCRWGMRDLKLAKTSATPET